MASIWNGRRRTAPAWFVAAALVATACGGDGEATPSGEEPAGVEDTTGDGEDGDAAEPVEGGELTVAVEAEPPGWHPATDACTEACLTVRLAVFDPLMELDENGEPQPYLAESLEPNADGSVWTMTLRDGVSFHNGTALDADAVVQMFEILQSEASTKVDVLRDVEAVTAEDELTVRFDLAAPSAGFPAALTTTAGLVFEPSLAREDPDGFSAEPIGTGPFTFEGWDRGSHVDVARNTEYWREDAAGRALPYLDGIRFRFIPDEEARLSSLEAGDVDVLQTLREASVQRARDMDAISTIEFAGNQSTGGLFNTATAPLDDLRVRRGLIALLDQDGLTAVLGGEGVAEPATQLAAPTHPNHSSDAASNYPISDTALGEELLAEYIEDPDRSDGRSPGDQIEITFQCLTDPSLVELAQAQQAMWEQTGQVSVDFSQVESAAHLDGVIGGPPDFEGTYQVACWRNGFEGDFNNARANFAPTEGNPSNFTNLEDEDLIGLFGEANATLDFDERAGLYQQVMARIEELAPEYYISHTVGTLAFGEGIRGLDDWTLPDGTTGSGIPMAVGRWVQVSTAG